MMISTKGRYALRLMVDLAEHQQENYIPLKEIAQRQELSEKYLESIIKPADSSAGVLHRGQHPALDRRFSVSCRLPGTGGERVPQSR